MSISSLKPQLQTLAGIAKDYSNREMDLLVHIMQERAVPDHVLQGRYLQGVREDITDLVSQPLSLPRWSGLLQGIKRTMDHAVKTMSQQAPKSLQKTLEEHPEQLLEKIPQLITPDGPLSQAFKHQGDLPKMEAAVERVLGERGPLPQQQLEQHGIKDLHIALRNNSAKINVGGTPVYLTPNPENPSGWDAFSKQTLRQLKLDTLAQHGVRSDAPEALDILKQHLPEPVQKLLADDIGEKQGFMVQMLDKAKQLAPNLPRFAQEHWKSLIHKVSDQPFMFANSPQWNLLQAEQKVGSQVLGDAMTSSLLAPSKTVHDLESLNTVAQAHGLDLPGLFPQGQYPGKMQAMDLARQQLQQAKTSFKLDPANSNRILVRPESERPAVLAFGDQNMATHGLNSSWMVLHHNGQGVEAFNPITAWKANLQRQWEDTPVGAALKVFQERMNRSTRDKT